MNTPVKGSIDYKHFGAEPKEWLADDKGKTLNWYNYHCAPKDYSTFLNNYIKKTKQSLELPKYIPGSIAVGALFMSTNRPLPKKVEAKVLEFVANLEPKKKVQEVQGKYVPSIQDRINEQVQAYCAVLDEAIDNLIDSKFCTNFDLNNFAKDIKSVQAKRIKDFYTKQYNDTTINDEFTKEGYSYMTKAEFKIYQNFLSDIIKVMSTREAIKPQRKTRKKKDIPLYKKVANVKYMESNKDYNIVSVDPIKIPGSTILLLLNCQSNTIHFLVSDSVFDIKGTKVLNVDEKKSFKQKLRKPLDFVSKINKTKTSVNKAIKELTTKSTETSSSINKNMVILRVF